MQNKKVYCSFCGKADNEVRLVIAGPSVFICDECIDICGIILAERRAEATLRERWEAQGLGLFPSFGKQGKDIPLQSFHVASIDALSTTP